MGSVTTFEFVGGGIVSVCRLPVKLLFPLFTRTNSENRRRSVTIFTRGGGGGGDVTSVDLPTVPFIADRLGLW